MIGTATFRLGRYLRIAGVAIIIVMAMIVINDFGSRRAEAVTPPTSGHGEGKPSSFAIWLPWRGSQVSGLVDMGYLYGDTYCNRPTKLHCDSDFYAIDFM